MLLAAKCALAAAIAWWLGSLLPGQVDQYSYYAPFGAILSMTPTLMGSVRSTLQTVTGLALGILIAWAVVFSPVPGPLIVPLAVGIGVILGGIGMLGTGRDYVAVSALFVLIIGGSDAEEYSLGYLAQMAIGMVVGVGVNFAVVPPLYIRDAAAEVSRLRTTAARALDEMAAALAGDWPPDRADWQRQEDDLRQATARARSLLDEAAESRRINPRSRRQQHDLNEDYDDLVALRSISAHIDDLSDVLSSAIWGDPVDVEMPSSLRVPLSDAIQGVADTLHAWSQRTREAEAQANAEARVRALIAMLNDDRAQPDAGTNQALGTVLFSLRRIIHQIESRPTR
ncbi:hypothetical protein GCM10027416_09570 [Okibacterium endophyticum]